VHTPFAVNVDEPVITTTYVTRQGMPILYVVHELDDRGGHSWQFHCGNGDYSEKVLQLVTLAEILAIDSTLSEVASMPPGFSARRENRESSWTIAAEM